MIIGKKDVKSAKESLGEASFSIYDSVEEAVAHEGESSCLSFVNAQVRTNAMNALRGIMTGKPSKSRIQLRVMNSLTTEDLLSIKDEPDSEEALNRLIQERVLEISRCNGELKVE